MRKLVKFRMATAVDERYTFVNPAYVCRVSDGHRGEWREIYTADGGVVAVREPIEDILKALCAD